MRDCRDNNTLTKYLTFQLACLLGERRDNERNTRSSQHRREWTMISYYNSSIMTANLTCFGTSSLSGSSLQTCDNTTGAWFPSMKGECISIPSSRSCHIITVAHASIARCAVNEMVINGGGQCATSIDTNQMVSQFSVSISSSTVMDDMQGWRIVCGNSSTLPLFVYAECCHASKNSFTRPSQSVLNSSSSLSTTGSFFRQCHLVKQLNVSSLMSSVQCAVNEKLISGGGACSPNAAIVSSVADNVTSWSIVCASTNNNSTSTFPTVSSAICCSGFAVNACSAQNNGALISSGIPESLAICLDDHSIMTDVGSTCPAGATQSSSHLFTAYGHTAIHTQCVSNQSLALVSPVTTSFLCCPLFHSPIRRSLVYCSSINVHARNNIGVITSDNSYAPLSYNATFTLTCPNTAPFSIIGHRQITCQDDGNWFPAEIGHCVLLDTSGCISVADPVINGANGTTVCPLDGEAWIMVGGGGLCSSNSVLSSDYPSSSRSWSSICYNNASQQYEAPYTVTGVCCPAPSYNWLSSCHLKSQCHAEELAISGGGQCPSSTTILSSQWAGLYQPQSWTTKCTSSNVTAEQAHVLCCSLPTLLLDVSVTSAASTSNSFMQCDVGQTLLASSATCNNSGGVIGSMFGFSGTSMRQVWSRSTACVDENTSTAIVAAICMANTPMCTFVMPLPTNLDTTMITMYWPANTTNIVYCRDGYSFYDGTIWKALSCLPDQMANLQIIDIPDCLYVQNTSSFHDRRLMQVNAFVLDYQGTQYSYGVTVLGSAGDFQGSYSVQGTTPYRISINSTCPNCGAWNILINLLWPLTSQLDGGNKFLGLQPSITDSPSVTGDTLIISYDTDQNMQVAGAIYAVSVDTISTIVVVEVVYMPCGCIPQSNPVGEPVNIRLFQSVGLNSILTFGFTPQSICYHRYKVMQMNGSYDNLIDVGLPILDTGDMETLEECPYASATTVNVNVLTWQSFGDALTYCIIPLPEKLCSGQ